MGRPIWCISLEISVQVCILQSDRLINVLPDLFHSTRSDNHLIRCLRGVFAILCLLLVTTLGIYTIMLMPALAAGSTPRSLFRSLKDQNSSQALKNVVIEPGVMLVSGNYHGSWCKRDIDMIPEVFDPQRLGAVPLNRFESIMSLTMTNSSDDTHINGASHPTELSSTLIFQLSK